MAVTSIFEGNLTKPNKENKKPLGFLSNQPQGGLFGNVQEQPQGDQPGIGQLATQGVRSMLTGDAYDAYKAQKQQSLARSIQNLRRSVGTQFGGSVGQSSYDRAQQRAEQGIFSELAGQNLAAEVEKQAMRERGIGAATGLAQAEQEARLKDTATGMQQAQLFGYRDPVTGQQVRGTQALEGLKTDIAQQQADTAREVGLAQIASQERLGMAGINVDQNKLAETARQFNISTEQAAKQFEDKLNFDYDSLSQQDKQFLTTMGFNREQFIESKRQFDETTALEDKLGTRNLDIKEQQIAQQAAQFTSKLEFDRWATQAGLDDAAKERIWKATENDKALAANRDIQQMVINNDQWKQGRVEALTREGWDIDSAENALNREQQNVIAEMQNALTREIESGRITMQQAQLVEQARQFDSKQAFDQWATEAGLDDATANRIWATSERIGSEAFQNSQNTYQAQLRRELAAGTWENETGETVNSMDAKNLMEQARQFDTIQEWEKEAAKQGFNSWDAKRAYEKNEIIEARQFQENMARLQNELGKAGIGFSTAMSYLETLPSEEAWDTIQALAQDSGITHLVRDAEGNLIEDPAGGYITKPGFAPTNSTVSQQGYNAITDLQQGERDVSDFKYGASESSPNHDEYMSLLNAADLYEPEFNVPDFSGASGYQGEKSMYHWKIDNMPETDSVLKYGDQVFQVQESSNAKKRLGQGARYSDEFIATDLNTGKEWLFRLNEDGEFYNTQL